MLNFKCLAFNSVSHEILNEFLTFYSVSHAILRCLAFYSVSHAILNECLAFYSVSQAILNERLAFYSLSHAILNECLAFYSVSHATQQVIGILQRGFEYQPKCCTYSAAWLLLGWCHVKLLPSRRTFCVHHATVHRVT